MIAKKMRRALEWRLTTLRMTRHHCSSNLAKLVSTPPDKEKAQMKGLIVSGMLAGIVLGGYFIQVLLNDFTFNCFYIKNFPFREIVISWARYLYTKVIVSLERILRGCAELRSFSSNVEKHFSTQEEKFRISKWRASKKKRERALQGVNDMQIIFL